MCLDFGSACIRTGMNDSYNRTWVSPAIFTDVGQYNNRCFRTTHFADARVVPWLDQLCLDDVRIGMFKQSWYCVDELG